MIGGLVGGQGERAVAFSQTSETEQNHEVLSSLQNLKIREHFLSLTNGKNEMPGNIHLPVLKTA